MSSFELPMSEVPDDVLEEFSRRPAGTCPECRGSLGSHFPGCPEDGGEPEDEPAALDGERAAGVLRPRAQRVQQVERPAMTAFAPYRDPVTQACEARAKELGVPLLAPLMILIDNHGRRDPGPSDELLPMVQQAPDIAYAMHAANVFSGRALYA